MGEPSCRDFSGEAVCPSAFVLASAFAQFVS